MNLTSHLLIFHAPLKYHSFNLKTKKDFYLLQLPKIPDVSKQGREKLRERDSICYTISLAFICDANVI